MLKAKIGEREAEAFVTILENKVDKKFEEAKSVLATKEDLVNTKTDIIKWVFAMFFALMLAIAGLYFKH